METVEQQKKQCRKQYETMRQERLDDLRKITSLTEKDALKPDSDRLFEAYSAAGRLASDFAKWAQLQETMNEYEHWSGKWTVERMVDQHIDELGKEAERLEAEADSLKQESHKARSVMVYVHRVAAERAQEARNRYDKWVERRDRVIAAETGIIPSDNRCIFRTDGFRCEAAAISGLPYCPIHADRWTWNSHEHGELSR